MIGETLAHYKITAKLGRGGMGEVYRARDTTLDRDVAIKVLPETFAQDPERVARFQREARTLASLNHANIAGIYGFEESGAHRFLAMELVEGEDLSERLARGPIPQDEFLDYARQMADGLEEAHEQGIVHRDLKPANLKITPDGKLKILDFGLARALQGKAVDEGEALENSPTITAAMTQPGVILGSAAYMAPEQAKGRTVDRRADLWAFGVILWEMLTGKRLFQGEDISDTLAAVLRDDPDWDALPEETPEGVRRLLARCLERDPRKRLRDIGEARVRLEQWTSDPSSLVEAPDDLPEIRTGGRSATWLPWVLVALASVAAVWGWIGRAPDANEATRHFDLDIHLEEASNLRGFNTAEVQISPDGAHLAYWSRDGLRVRRLDQRGEQLLAGTDNADDFSFSPDSRWIAFSRQGRLQRVGITGGAPIEIASITDSRGIAWINPTTIVYAPTFVGGLFVVDITTGQSRPLTVPDAEAGERSHRWPGPLPGGTSVVFQCQFENGEYDEGELRVVDLDGTQTTVHRGGTFPRYAPSGHLLFVRDTSLFALPFDPETRTVSGFASVVLDRVWAQADQQETHDGSAQYSFSEDGLLVYRIANQGDQSSRVMEMDLATGVTTRLTEAHEIRNMALSPDGSRLATTIREPNGEIDVYILDLETETLSPFTFTAGEEQLGCWSEDSGSFYWRRSDGQGRYEIVTRPIDGSRPETVLYSTPDNTYPNAISPDGRILAMSSWRQPGQWDIIGLDLQAPEAEPEVLVGGADQQLWACFSPDGRWYSYFTNEGGQFVLMVRAYPDTGVQWRAFTGEDLLFDYPTWLTDMSAILVRGQRGMWRVPIQAAGTSFSVGNPEFLRADNYLNQQGASTAAFRRDGTKVYLLESAGAAQDRPPSIVLRSGWFEALERSASGL